MGSTHEPRGGTGVGRPARGSSHMLPAPVKGQGRALEQATLPAGGAEMCACSSAGAGGAELHMQAQHGASAVGAHSPGREGAAYEQASSRSKAAADPVGWRDDDPWACQARTNRASSPQPAGSSNNRAQGTATAGATTPSREQQGWPPPPLAPLLPTHQRPSPASSH